MRKMWCIPPAQSAEFVAKMEDVLEVYLRPYDPKRPVVCMDEQPFQLLAETRELIPMSEQNHTVKADHEYERRGACCVFMATEPLGGYRHTEVRGTRTKKDWAVVRHRFLLAKRQIKLRFRQIVFKKRAHLWPFLVLSRPATA